LSLLIDTGIPGLFFCTLFFLFSVVECGRLLPLMPPHTAFGRAYRVLFAYLAVQVIYFYAIIGDPVSSVSRILFTFMLLKILVHSQGEADPPSSLAAPPGDLRKQPS
jgi:hypothetical protein